jgi:ABC-type multidrug transport system ATPase subunit
VAVQLLLDPAICLLDEPTTGLDTFTARHVIETLKSLALNNRTVVLSIHQPRYDVFKCLDDVVLLARGRQVWTGSCKDMLRHFSAVGYPCPALTNPADFILDISSIDVSFGCLVHVKLWVNLFVR